MHGLIGKVGPIRFRARRLAVFHALTRAIVYQQLSGKAASTIFGRFEALFPGGQFPAPEQVLEMPVERLRGAGLSRQKIGYITDLAARSAAGEIPSLDACDLLADDEIITRLTAVKGIGRWTVEMLLIFNLGRPDVLPVGDLGVRRGYQIAYGKRKMPEPERLADWGRRWAPHRTMAARYLWRAADGGGA